MTFISYAQNFEDVLLWRALGHIKNGFYIDVGANDPVEHSVTKAFYDAGWRGISIEPLPTFHAAFMEQRRRDVNLAVAAGSREGELTLYDVPEVRGWASPERAVADQHRAEGYAVTSLTVPVRTLDAICAEHVKGEIHFLKIDVEGFEGEVLRGIDLARWRPWIMVIEATLPGSRETKHETWEALATGQRYRFVWFDGLNRYYVAEEHPELLAAFGVQPNVFDEFISHHLDKAWAANKKASDAIEALDRRLVRSEARQQAADQRAAQSAALAQEALAHSRELLGRLDQSELRLRDEQRARAASEQERQRLNAQLTAARAERAALAGARDALQQQLAELGTAAHHTSVWAQQLEQQVLAMQASRSWRLTRPLRATLTLLHALRRPHLLGRLSRRLTSNERMRRLFIPLLLRFPWLRARASQALAVVNDAPPAPPPERLVPASVRAVLSDLQRARDNHKGS